MPASSSQKLDFLIVTALEEELQAVRYAFEPLRRIRNIETSLPGRAISVAFESKYGTIISGLIASPFQIGQLDTAIFVARLLSDFQFSVVGLAGLAAGVRQGQRNDCPSLGDIVFANKIIDINISKIFDPSSINYRSNFGVFVSRPRVYEIKKHLEVSFDEHYRKEIKQRILKYQNKISHGYQMPRVFVGPVLSTNVVIASRRQAEGIADEVHNLYGQDFPIGIEMEGYGVCRAVEIVAPETSVFLCKSINDYADSSKGLDEGLWREISCRNSAIAAKGFIEHLQNYPKNKAGKE